MIRESEAPMLTKVFLGLTFFEDNHFARKIQNFRSRYDEKVLTKRGVFLPIVAPFEVPQSTVRSLEEEVAEEVGSFFPADEDTLTLGFTGIDVHSHARKMLLYLRPDADTDLAHCAEALEGICRSYVEHHECLPAEGKSFLTIGRFQDPTSLHAAISIAQKEFSDCAALPAKGVCLFVKQNGVWLEQAELHGFAGNNESALYGGSKA